VSDDAERSGMFDAIIEALLFATDEPLSSKRIAEVIGDLAPGSVEEIVEGLNADYLREDRAFRIEPVAGGWRLVTRREFAEWVGRLFDPGSRPRLSQAALETLAIVAYKQPVTRAELESIRGVNVDAVLRTLVDRDLVTIAGREEGIGRPLLYRTTDHFLEYFGLPGLEALPKPEELRVLFADRVEREPETGEGSTGEADPGQERLELDGREADRQA